MAPHLNGLQQADYNRAAVQPVTNKVLSRCRKILATPEVNLDSISPFFIHSIYSAAVTSIILGAEESSSSRRLIEQTLQKLNERWKLAGMFCRIVEESFILIRELTICGRRILGAHPNSGGYAAIASCRPTQEVPNYRG